ncbi:MAG TPA: glycosyltransferase, partial [Stellaceae bacterium]|nr:glycosyltransferase [Stellaceae bacterium]
APDGAVLAAVTLAAGGDAPAAFRLPMPRQPMAALELAVGGVPLIGSGLAVPPDFALDGRATEREGRIEGWVRLGWHPSAAVTLVLEDGRGGTARVASTPDAGGRGRHRFALDPAAARLQGNEIFIAAVLPDGAMQHLPDTPLLLDKGVPPLRARRIPARPKGAPAVPLPRPVTIIVPVYLGREETLAALRAARETARPGDEILVIDDASPDAALAADLDALAAAGAITLLRNDSNLGFAATVNRGLAESAGRDAILLNADTVVFGDWIDRLQRAAYRDPAIGTVTPLTNRGAVASYPGGAESDCTRADAAAIDRIAARVNPGASVALPVGVGFCLYLRRDCLDETGDFDAALFGRGYGEENDFCLRAARHGWRHVLAGDVFVQHVGGRSFGPRAAALRERNRRLLNLRHPGYDARVEAFAKADPARPLRRRIDAARLGEGGRRYALVVTLGLTGGVERHVAERCRALEAAGLVPLLLRPGENGTGCVLAAEDGRFGDLAYTVPGELGALEALLAAAPIAAVEIHHFLDHDSRVIEAVRALGVPYDVYVHDYVWICPRVGLVDGQGRYCGEPGPAACEACVKKNGAALKEPISVRDLRRRSARWLGEARAVIVPCADVAARLARHFPGLEPRVAPWETEPVPGDPPAPRPGPVRVALIGAIGEHKGYRLLKACAADAAARGLDLEFVVLGYSEDDQALIDTGKVFVTGRYAEPELAELMRRERPHLLFFPSVTPETWCFALTEALRSGVPIAALAHGAIAERLRRARTGLLLPVGASARQVNDRLIAAARAPSASQSATYKASVLS